MEASDVESEGSRPVGLDYLAVFDREVVQRVVQVRHLAGLVPEPDELPVVLQDEIPGSPIPYVFSCNDKKNGELVIGRIVKASREPKTSTSSFRTCFSDLRFRVQSLARQMQNKPVTCINVLVDLSN